MPSIVNDYRVAIIGGGIAGASLANALVKIDRVQFEIYESGAEFSERGAAVGLAANAQRALDRVTPSAEALLTRASAVAMASSRLQLVRKQWLPENLKCLQFKGLGIGSWHHTF